MFVYQLAQERLEEKMPCTMYTSSPKPSTSSEPSQQSDINQTFYR